MLVAGRDAKWQGVREFFRQRLGVLLPRGIELKLRAIEGLPDTVRAARPLARGVFAKFV